MKGLIILLLIICTLPCRGQIISTVAGSGSGSGSASGNYFGDSYEATNAGLNNPMGAVIGSNGVIYVSDFLNSRVRKIDTNGIITTYAGNGTYGYSGEGVPATDAEMKKPSFLFVGNNSLYIPDGLNSRIRKVSPSGIITTIAGKDTAGYTGDNGPATAAELCTPVGIKMDGNGNIYYADDACSIVRKIDTVGIITTVAGNGVVGYGGDNGPADSAAIQNCVDIAIDKIGNMYIADMNNNRIRKVDTIGNITTYAGTGDFGYSGDHGQATAAKMYYPQGLTVDGAGQLYFADCGNNVIRKIDTLGIVTTVVGNGYGAGSGGTVGGFFGDGGLATNAELFAPEGIAFDGEGNLYIADCYNNRIRKVTHLGIPLEVRGIEKWRTEINVYPNPATNWLAVEHADGGNIMITDCAGRQLEKLPVVATGEIQMVNIEGLQAGMYIVEVVDKEGIKTIRKIVKMK